jgi:hypothetical protein
VRYLYAQNKNAGVSATKKIGDFNKLMEQVVWGSTAWSRELEASAGVTTSGTCRSPDQPQLSDYPDEPGESYMVTSGKVEVCLDEPCRQDEEMPCGAQKPALLRAFQFKIEAMLGLPVERRAGLLFERFPTLCGNGILMR